MRKETTSSGNGRSAAFTLIELLVVIAIIGVLAGLLIPLSGIATTKMRIARVKAELNNYVTAIESYKSETGFYPPDNGALKKLRASDPIYSTSAALNPLFYELSGAVFSNKQFRALADNEVITTNDLGMIFNRDGIANSARDRFDVPYKGFSVKAFQYAELSQGTDVEILAVPVPGPVVIPGKTKKINPWFYDASSTNRNNLRTFDLWAEISVAGKTNIIGNWKI